MLGSNLPAGAASACVCRASRPHCRCHRPGVGVGVEGCLNPSYAPTFKREISINTCSGVPQPRDSGHRGQASVLKKSSGYYDWKFSTFGVPPGLLSPNLFLRAAHQACGPPLADPPALVCAPRPGSWDRSGQGRSHTRSPGPTTT